MRCFALVAVALAVVPSTLAFPVFKRSDAHLEDKDQKSQRTTFSFDGTVNQYGSQACGTGVGVLTMGSTMNCHFQNSQAQPTDNGYSGSNDAYGFPAGYPPNINSLGPDQPFGAQSAPSSYGVPNGYGNSMFANGPSTAAYDPNFANIFGKEAKKDSDNAV